MACKRASASANGLLLFTCSLKAIAREGSSRIPHGPKTVPGNLQSGTTQNCRRNICQRNRITRLPVLSSRKPGSFLAPAHVVAASLCRGADSCCGWHGDTAPWLQSELVVCRFLPAMNLPGKARNHGRVLSLRAKIARLQRVVIQIVQFIQILVAQFLDSRRPMQSCFRRAFLLESHRARAKRRRRIRHHALERGFDRARSIAGRR